MPQQLCVDPFLYIRKIEGQFSVDENARRLLRYRYAEVKMMEMQSGWIATMPSEKVKLGLGVNCYDCATHADALGERLPELRRSAPDAMESPHEAFTRLVGGLGDQEDMLLRMVGLHRVLKPHLLVVYYQHIAITDHVLDMPTVRMLRRIVDDETRHVLWGWSAIEELAGAPRQRREMAAWQGHLEELLVEAGGITGDCW